MSCFVELAQGPALRPCRAHEYIGVRCFLPSAANLPGHFFVFYNPTVAFRMYDLDGDDRISKEELLAVLTMMVGANICEEQLVSIAERTIMEADTDKDNLISFQEFKKVLERTDVEQKMSIRFLS